MIWFLMIIEIILGRNRRICCWCFLKTIRIFLTFFQFWCEKEKSQWRRSWRSTLVSSNLIWWKSIFSGWKKHQLSTHYKCHKRGKSFNVFINIDWLHLPLIIDILLTEYYLIWLFYRMKGCIVAGLIIEILQLET